jgi:osmotically-inducible protein OsmY
MNVKSDEELQAEVQNEFAWEPLLNGNGIHIRIKQGVIFLSGVVTSLLKKRTAERAAARVVGTKNIRNELKVVLSDSDKKSDEEIQSFFQFALKGFVLTQHEQITVQVQEGCVLLSGQVEWDIHKQSAERIAESLVGVLNVINSIEVVQGKLKAEVEKQIQAAFYRHAAFDLRKIEVESEGGRIYLTGEVRSGSKKRDAENAAWATNGVKEVISYLTIEEELTVL